MAKNLLNRIDRLLRNTGIPPTTMSRAMMRDPLFIQQFRNGRCPRAATLARVAAWLDEAERAVEDGRWER